MANKEQGDPLKKETPFTWDQGDGLPDSRYTGLGQGGHAFPYKVLSN